MNTMKYIALTALLLISTWANSETLKLTQIIEIAITDEQGKSQMINKTALLDQPVTLQLGEFQFNIKTQQINQSSQAMVETQISQKDSEGQFKVISSPTLVVMFKKQGQIKTEIEQNQIDMKVIVHKTKVASM